MEHLIPVKKHGTHGRFLIFSRTMRVFSDDRDRGVLPKSIALVVVLLNTKFEISRQPKWYLPKAQRIWAWGTAPLRNPMSFWKVPF